MEEILIVVFQALFGGIAEVFFDLVMFWPFNTAVEKVEARYQWFWSLFLMFFGGIGMGWLSILLVPHVLIESPYLRVVNLLCSPLLGGFFFYLFAKHRGTARLGIHFWTAFVFGIAFSGYRFAFSPR